MNNFKDDFLIFLDFFAPFQILSKPYINGKMIYSLVTGLVVQGHILSTHAVINAAF